MTGHAVFRTRTNRTEGALVRTLASGRRVWRAEAFVSQPPPPTNSALAWKDLYK